MFYVRIVSRGNLVKNMLLKVKKIVKQYNTFICWCLIGVLMISVCFAMGVFFKGTTNEMYAKEPITLVSDERYQQNIIVDRNLSIDSFSLLFGTYARENKGDLNVSIYLNEQLVEVWKIETAQLGDNEYFQFELSEDLKVRKTDQVYLEIYEVHEGDNAIAVWLAENVEASLFREGVLIKDKSICYKINYSESLIDFIWNNIAQIMIAIVMGIVLKYMWNKCKKGADKGYLIFLLTLLSSIFAILYFPYITGEKVYIYEGIGCATLNQYWPKYLFNTNYFHNIGNDGYTLQLGFGKYVHCIGIKFLNPFDWVFLIMDEVYALIVSLYLKIIWTGCFAWLYFRKKFKCKETALICAILWTYGGWFVLWGQHYAFASYYAYFTAILLFLELQLKKNKYAVLLPIMLAVMTGNNYYFTYMIGIFCVVYTIFTALKKAWSIKEIIFQLIKLAIAEVIAVGISFVQLYPSLDSFLHSNRTDSLKMVGEELFKPREWSYLITYVGRMLSSNIWGVQEYSGTCNYYEMAISYSSSLVILAIVYFLFTKHWKKVLFSMIAVCVLIMLPISSKVLQFDTDSYRWTFLINVGMVLLAGEFIEAIRHEIKENNLNKIYKVVIISNIVVVALLLVFVLLSKFNIYGLKLDKIAVVQICIIWGILDLIVIFQKIKKSVTWECVIPAILMFICVEQLFMNYYVVNNRMEISSYSLENGYYNDSTIDIVEDIKLRDSSLYRLNKTYYSVFYDDAYAQGYNGVSIYASTNSSSLHNFIKNLEIENLNNHQNYISIKASDVFVNELLAVKYLIAETPIVPQDGYIEVFRKDNLVLYQDINALPFGYLYTEQLDMEQYSLLEGTENKSLAMMLGFYFEEKIDGYEIANLSTADWKDKAKVGREKLRDTHIYDVKLDKNIYSAKVVNDSEANAMLCVPLIYSDRWNAIINGESVKTYMINGGLVGVEIPTGEYVVEIAYNAADYDIALIVSIISIVLYSIFIVGWSRKTIS